MTKKKIFLFLSFMVLFLAISLGVIAYNINPIVEKFRHRIAEKLSDTLGRQVTLGTIDATLFPTLKILVHDVELGNDGQKPLFIKKASLAGASLLTSLFELLQGELSIRSISLEDAKLQVTRTPAKVFVLGEEEPIRQERIKSEGEGSPKRLQAEMLSSHSPSTSSHKLSAEVPFSQSSSSLHLEIQKVELKDISLTFVDQAVGPPQTIDLRDINGSLSDIDLRDPSKPTAKISVSAGFLSKKKNNLVVSGNLANPLTKGALDIALELRDVTLSVLQGLLAAYGVQVSQLKMDETGILRLQGNSSKNGLKLIGKLEAREARLIFGDLFQKEPGTELSLAFDATVPTSFPSTHEGGIASKTVLILDNIHLNALSSFQLGKPLNVEVNSEQFPLSNLMKFLPLLKSYHLKGDLVSHLNATLPMSQSALSQPKQGNSRLALRGLLELKNAGLSISPEATESKTSSKKPLVVDEINGKIEFSGDSAATNAFSFIVNGQKFDLKGKAESFDRPTVAFVLASAHVDVMPLLEAFIQPGSNLKNSMLEDVQLSGNYGTASKNGEISFTSKQAHFANIASQRLALSATISPEKVLLKPSSLALFGGNLEIQGSLERHEPAQLRASLKASKLNMGQISELTNPEGKIRLTGIMEGFTSRIEANTKRMTDTLSGLAEFSISSGQIEGFNILRQTLAKLDAIPDIQGALQHFVPEKFQPILETNATPFDVLSGDAMFENGNTKIKELSLKHSLYIITGTGDLKVNGNMEIHGQLKLTKELALGMVLKQPKLKLFLDEDQGIAVPVVIRRQDGSTIVLPDTSLLLKRAATNTAREAAGRALEKLVPGLGKQQGVEKDLGEEAKKVLDSLFR